MKRSLTGIVAAFVLFGCGSVWGDTCQTVILHDDFDDPPSGMPDPADWVVNHPGEPWWVQGRTHFPDPNPWLGTGEFPRVENGVCIIEHHLYNPYDLGDPNTVFLGGEIHTVLEFSPDSCYYFEARVRFNTVSPYLPPPDGLVASFFLYGYDGAFSDEIDYEYVTNKINDDVSYPAGDPALTNAWNESAQHPEYVYPDGLDMTEWNTFRIYWCATAPSIRWTWLDPVNGEVVLRTVRDPDIVPDEPMSLYFNFWAPDAGWMDAYSADLQPVNTIGENEIYAYEIDYVEVCQTSGPVPAVSEWGFVIMTLLALTVGTQVFLRRREVPS